MSPDAVTCRHHWIIEPANGPTSHGCCLRCGAERNFANWSDMKTYIPSATDRALIAAAKREEEAVRQLIHDFGQDDYKPLSSYRRNARNDYDG